ncbi:type II toxin-antitoxin system Phd/YefM family antitoxin [Nocardia xishanensis]
MPEQECRLLGVATGGGEAEADFRAVLDAATEDSDEVVIDRNGGGELAVVIGVRECEALRETAYLLGSRANARRLMESLDNVELGLSHRARRPMAKVRRCEPEACRRPMVVEVYLVARAVVG